MLPNACRYNVSYAEVITGSSKLYATFLYPSLKPQICINNWPSNKECGLYTHEAYISQDWPDNINNVQDIFTFKGGSSNSIVHHFPSLQFMEVLYQQEGLYFRTALFSLHMRKVALCSVLPDGDIYLHAIFASSMLLSLCNDLSQLQLPNKFNAVSLRLETIQNEAILNYIKQRLTSVYIRIEPSHIMDNAISVSIYLSIMTTVSYSVLMTVCL